MSDPRTPVFLERQSYRRRRLIDSIRLVPILGIFLWSIPLLWRMDSERGVSTASGIIYIFGVWIILVALTGLLARGVKRAEANVPDGERRWPH